MSDLDILKDIPGYKAILKSVLKSQIQLLIEQLADHTGEESIILTASINDGTLSHLGSNTGKGFLEGRDEIKSQFLGFCLKSHHRRKTQEIQNHSRPSMPQHHPSKRSRIRPVPYSLPQTSSPITASMSVNRKGSISDITNLDQSNNIGIKAEESENADLDNFLNNVSTNVDNDYASNVPASVHLSHTQSANQNESFGDLSHSSVPNSRDDQNTMVSNVKLEPVSQDDLDIEVTGVELGDNSLSSEAWGQGYGSGGNNDNDRQSGDQAGYNSSEQAQDGVDGMSSHAEPLGGIAFPGLDNSHHDFRTHLPEISPNELKQALYPEGNTFPNTSLVMSAQTTSAISPNRRGTNYWCKICNKILQNKGLFDYHIRAHSGVKPYECKLCHRKFAGKQVLETHMRLHSGEKPFKCEIEGCNRAFSARSGLVYHVKKHH